MKSMFKIFGSTVFMVAMLMVTGCGRSGEPAQVVTQGTQITADQATLNADGTVTTTAAITALTPAIVFMGTAIPNLPAVIIPAGTVITARDANGAIVPFTSLPVINVSEPITPLTGVDGMPPNTGNATVATSAGAIDVTIGGANRVTFSQPIQINIPTNLLMTPAGATVFTNKNDGNPWVNLGAGIITPVQLPLGLVTITTSNLCWFGVNLTFNPPTETTGTGGTGGNNI